MTVIVKTTHACNAGCVYCSAWREDGGARGSLGLDLARRLLQALQRHGQDHPRERFSVTWHGGEPLLLGPAFFRGVADEVDRLDGAFRARLGFSIQTNLLQLDAEFVDLFRTLRMAVGTSVDPIHPTRRDRAGQDYYPAWFDRYRLLRTLAPELEVGLIYVVHRDALGDAARLYRYFRNLGARNVRFNPLYLEGRARGQQDLSPTGEEYGRFLVDLAREWRRDGRTVRVQPLAEWAAALAPGGRPPTTCENRGDCGFTHLALSPDGRVSNCGRFVDGDLETYGNLWTDELSTILAAPARQALQRRPAALQAGECRDCRWWRVCAGGCPSDAWIAFGDPLRRTNWCEGRKAVFEHLAEEGE